MRSIIGLLLVALCLGALKAQESIDGSFAFSNDPAKKYSIYVPSSYDENAANKLMLGFHPLNTNRWDAEAWRDTLTVFAETNDLILICPDGGADGAVDDPIDFAFTDAVLDSMEVWYNIDLAQKYIIGFSWGGRATYRYGLDHAEEFNGFIPIGAAINGIQEVFSSISNGEKEKFYIVHGSNDSPSVRFTPIRDALISEGACVETNLLSGVGHTIDFANRNNILNEAFAWVSDPLNCTSTNSIFENDHIDLELTLQGNPIKQGQDILVKPIDGLKIKEAKVYSIEGKLLKESNRVNWSISSSNIDSGLHLLKLTFTNDQIGMTKIIIE